MLRPQYLQMFSDGCKELLVLTWLWCIRDNYEPAHEWLPSAWRAVMSNNEAALSVSPETCNLSHSMLVSVAMRMRLGSEASVQAMYIVWPIRATCG